MGKRKFSFWLSMGALCLCLATLAFGVYSAKQARLTTNGTVSFKANDCKVKVVGTISNAMRSESLNYAQVSDKTYSNDGSGNTVSWADSFTTGDNYLTSSDAWTFGDIYFDDMNIGNDEEIKSIIITLQISNYSSFPVKASFTAPTELDSNLSIDGSVMEVVLDKMTTTTPTTSSLVLKITVTDKTKEVGKQNLNLSVNFEKSEMHKYVTDYGNISESSYASESYNKLSVTKNLSPNKNEEVEIPASVYLEDKNFKYVDWVSFELSETCPYKVVMPEGVKYCDFYNDNYDYGKLRIASIVLPKTFKSTTVDKIYAYEIYNNSGKDISSYVSSETFAVHTDMNEPSVLKTTSDGIVYYPDTAKNKAYILGIRKSGGEITLPENIEGLPWELKNRPFAGYDGKIYVSETNSTYASTGDILYEKANKRAIWISKKENIVIPKEIEDIEYIYYKAFHPEVVKKVTVETGNTVYASNGDVLYDLNNHDTQWVSPKESIIIPENLTGDFRDNIIPSTVTNITVETGNTVYASNGDVLYKSQSGTHVWVSPKESIIIPKEIKSQYFNIPYSVRNVSVETGNTIIASNGDVIYRIQDGSLVSQVCSLVKSSITIPKEVVKGISRYTFGSYAVDYTEINVDPENTVYASNGDVLYEKSTGTPLWITSRKETITLPKELESLSNLSDSSLPTNQHVYVESGSKFLASNGDVVYRLDEGYEGRAIWFAQRESIIIPAEFTDIATTIPSKIKTMTVAPGNTSVAIKNDVLYSISTGQIIWVSPNVEETLTLPEGVKVVYSGSIDNGILKTLNLPKTLTSIIGVPSTVKTITVDSGNTTYKIDESGNLVTISDNTIVWTKPAN